MKRRDYDGCGSGADGAALHSAPFVPRRRVTMHIEDMTERVKEWSKLTRLEFNRKLEEWYNSEGTEQMPAALKHGDK